MKRRLFLLVVAVFIIGLPVINAQPFAYLTTKPFGGIYDRLPSIFVINLATKDTTATLPVPFPTLSFGDIAITPDGSNAIVTAADFFSYSELLLVVDTTVNQITNGISIGSGDGCNRVLVSPDGLYAYTACKNSGIVKVVDLNKYWVTTVPIGGQPTDIAISPDGSRLYVTGCGFIGQSVCIIDTATETLAATLDINSKRVAVTPDGSLIYLLLNNGNLAVLDATTNMQVAVELYYWDWINDMIIAPDGKHLYTIGPFGVTVVDTLSNTAVQQINVPGSIISGVIAISPDGKYIYVPDSNRIWVISTDTNTLIDMIDLSQPFEIQAMAITPVPAESADQD